MKQSIRVSNLTLSLYLDFVRPVLRSLDMLEEVPAKDETHEYTAEVIEEAIAEEITHCMTLACFNAHGNGNYVTLEEASQMVYQLEVSSKYTPAIAEAISIVRNALIIKVAETLNEVTETTDTPKNEKDLKKEGKHPMSIEILDPVEAMPYVQMLHVTVHKSTSSSHSKLDGMSSISSSASTNTRCQQYAQIPGSICEHCYAQTMAKRFKNLRDCTVTNGLILQNYLLPEKALAMLPVNTPFARIEAFGDVSNVTQARNYIRIIRSHPLTNWGIWSKSPDIWNVAFELEGKPENTTYVHSSLFTDKIGTVPDYMQPYVDHVFTVYSKGTDREILCGGRHCMSCLRCYRKDTEYHVTELKK